MIITKEIEIDMGHRITSHKSKCASLHGHRYRIEVGVEGEVIAERGSSDEGMVIDFGDLKEVMMNVLDNKYDHGFVLWEEDPMVEAFLCDKSTKLTLVPFIPTAENLAVMWFEELEVPLRKRNIRLETIRVWETPTSTAIHSTEF